MASLSSVLSPARVDDLPQSRSIRAIFRSWAAELAPFPNRWRRAARVGFVTAVGAGVMASLQIANPLGLTLIVNFAAPEFAFSLGTGVTFLIAAAAIQLVTLTAVGATVDNPVVHVCAFLAFCAITTYLIYGIPKLGRLWLWIQIPAVSAFYLVLFDHRSLGWDCAQMFAGVAVAVAILWLFNNLIWPEPAASVLRRSLRSTLERSRRRLILLNAIFVGDAPASYDRGVASKLAYHLALLNPASRQAKSTREAGELLAAVMVAERIHNAIDRLCEVACTQAGAACEDQTKLDLLETSTTLGAALEEYVVEIGRPADESKSAEASLEAFHARMARLDRSGDANTETRTLAEFAHHLNAIAALLAIDPSELPTQSQSQPMRPSARRASHLNKFLVRFSARHTVAMTVTFVAGLFDNNAALHAALWLLMIGGPPSHGATAKKFTTRAIGASGALIFATLATIVLAPNFTSLPPYIAAIFLGVLIITYIGEGGGELSYLAVGSTAFVIAFSGPGPRRDIVGSIWTIWGISLGMIIRAVISVVSIERPNRTLAEEMERPLNALAELTPAIAQSHTEVAIAEAELIAGIEEMLEVAADAQLQGSSAGIDARNLVDALDTMRRLAFLLGNVSHQQINQTVGDEPARAASQAFAVAVRARFDGWLGSIRDQLEPGQLTEAPLRTMITSATAPELVQPLERLRQMDLRADLSAREHVSALIYTLERQLALVSLSAGDGLTN